MDLFRKKRHVEGLQQILFSTDGDSGKEKTGERRGVPFMEGK